MSIWHTPQTREGLNKKPESDSHVVSLPQWLMLPHNIASRRRHRRMLCAILSKDKKERSTNSDERIRSKSPSRPQAKIFARPVPFGCRRERKEKTPKKPLREAFGINRISTDLFFNGIGILNQWKEKKARKRQNSAFCFVFLSLSFTFYTRCGGALPWSQRKREEGENGKEKKKCVQTKTDENHQRKKKEGKMEREKQQQQQQNAREDTRNFGAAGIFFFFSSPLKEVP
jgi:hypothetical protein